MGGIIRSVVAATCAAALAAIGIAGTALASSPAERISEAVQVLKEMSSQEDYEAMAYILKRAQGVAIFPSVLKAGLMLGARHGEGLVLRRDPGTGKWYGPSFVTITGLSWGPQIGVQSTALVLVITNERGLKGFEEGKITLGGEMSIAAGPVGRHAEAGTDIELKAAIYSYSMSKGVFAGASLEGARIAEDESANELYWGAKLAPDSILARVASDQRVRALVEELDRLISSAAKAKSTA
ncbi:MAG: lipid-binding SYLF domain-containing protein [Firmicutes bacterium]|nr:lipid-binding SYLF domain-containing protein [Bacillota bacterium]MDH7496212.1 lipid-binding SYLF domain-containing protein [Bacillota bacterium]